MIHSGFSKVLLTAVDKYAEDAIFSDPADTIIKSGCMAT